MSGLQRRAPLQRGAPLQRKARLRPRSKKREREYVDRRKLVAQLLEERPHCEMGPLLATVGVTVCTYRSVDVHELLSRGRGGSILAEDNLITGCRNCHDHVTRNPAQAEGLGLALKTTAKSA